MYIPQKLEPIYKAIINSPKEIEELLSDRESDKEKISEILKSSYIVRVEEIPYCLDLGYLFKEAYWNSLGFTTCLDVVKGMASYRELLSRSITLYNDILTPLFIRSFKCYQTALHCFREGQQETAVAEMTETGKIAEKIALECQNLGKEFDSLRTDEKQVLIGLTKDQIQVFAKKRELSKKQSETGSTSPHLLEPILEAGISSLDEGAIKPMFKIITVLANMSLFWVCAENHSERLAHPLLADPDVVEVLASREPKKAEEEFNELLKNSAERENDIRRSMQGLFKSIPEKKSLPDVVKTMKTGRLMIQTPDPSLKHLEIYHNRMKQELTRGIEEEFENSYLNWLALAKISQATIAAAEMALIGIDEKLNAISQLDREPLVTALHEESGLHS